MAKKTRRSGRTARAAAGRKTAGVRTVAKKVTRKAAKKKAAARPAKKSRTARYVYFFGDGKADGNRDMKDLLGGKGAGLAEMTNAGLPVPPGFTISTEACTPLLSMRRGRSRPPSTRRCRGLPAPAGEGGGGHAGLDRESAAGLGPVGREVLDARHDGHDPEPRPERRRGRGAEAPDVERTLRLRQLPPVHPDVRQRRAGDSEGRLRARARGGQEGARRDARHRTWTRRRCARWSSATRSVVQKRTGKAFPQDPHEQLRMARDAVFRSWKNPRANEYRRIYDIPDPHRHGGQRPDDGLRQHGRPLGDRRRLHAEPRERREGVLRRVPRERAGRGRGGRHPDAAADHRARDR